MSKTSEYQKKASASYAKRQKAAGNIKFTRWIKNCPELIKQLIALIENYKG